MRKILLAIALLLSVLGLAACSSGEEVGVKPATQTQSAKVDIKDQVIQLKDSEVVFNYEGKDVNGKELKEFADTNMSQLGESKKFDKESVVRRYILQNELVKYVGLSQKELDEKHKLFAEEYKFDKMVDISKGEFIKDELQPAILLKDYSSNGKVISELYKTLNEKAKKHVSEESFKTNTLLFYQELKKNKTESKKLNDFQQKLINDSGANGIDLKVQDEKTELIL
ncbi:hypothetical protein [Bacillus sp. ISL-57]|uniref:hypothetical protein n=1 Tax=Bacillus sp. ISL-57 TaxID=2819135 RepID=UPI001BE5C79F|nr:hypothetical protein [Bacillus sp. ISL-57]MBT2716906.1 hypothetical protein [Bacillus sp. ISL-57]